MAKTTRKKTHKEDRVRRFLDPEVVSKLNNMELRARLVVEGFIQGLHRSPYHGFSVEFAEYRQYIPGDSPRFVDWKLFGKTDRYYVKVFEEETNLKGVVLLDKSASMGFANHGISKLRWGSLLAAALNYLMIKQQDATGLVVFDDSIREFLPPRSVRGQLHQCLALLEKLQPTDRTDISAAFHHMAERLKRRGLVIVISDLFDEPEAIIKGLKHFRHRQHEVMVFHVLDELELTFDYKEEARFIDMESGREIRSQPWFVRGDYQDAVVKWKRHLERECRNQQIDYIPVTTSTPFDRALMSYINKRGHLG